MGKRNRQRVANIKAGLTDPFPVVPDHTCLHCGYLKITLTPDK